MKISVVLNSSAGSLVGRGMDGVVREVEEAFRTAGHSVVCAHTPGRGLEKAIRGACAGDADVVVVGGGDGTIATATHLLAGTGKALGILPLGTMNLLARDLDIPLDLDQAIKALSTGTVEAIDMAEVNGRPFLNNSVIGIYPRMVQEREYQRGAHRLRKWPAMGLAVVKTLIDFPKLVVEVETPDGRERLASPFVVVANNRYDEGAGPVLHRKSLTGGKLVIYVSRHFTRWRFLRLVAKVFRGDWHGDPHLDVHEVTEAVVRTARRRLRVANDGEVLKLDMPLRYRIHPGGLRVLRPRREGSLEPAPLRSSA